MSLELYEPVLLSFWKAIMAKSLIISVQAYPEEHETICTEPKTCVIRAAISQLYIRTEWDAFLLFVDASETQESGI